MFDDRNDPVKRGNNPTESKNCRSNVLEQVRGDKCTNDRAVLKWGHRPFNECNRGTTEHVQEAIFMQTGRSGVGDV